MNTKNTNFKNSGIAWIGEIPKHWEVTKINHLYSQRNQKVSDKDFEPINIKKLYSVIEEYEKEHR